MNIICRACMSTVGPMKYLFSFYKAYSTTFMISEIFASCTSLKVTKDDGLPEYLCSKCHSQLKQWFKFRQTCTNSDIQFRDSLSKNTVSEAENSIMLNDLYNISEGNSNLKMKDSDTELSPVVISVVNNKHSKGNLGNEKVTKNEIASVEANTRVINDREEVVDPLTSKEENFPTQEDLVENGYEENLQSVRQDPELSPMVISAVNDKHGKGNSTNEGATKNEIPAIEANICLINDREEVVVPLAIKEEDFLTEEDLVENGYEEILHSVKMDHSYANEKGVNKNKNSNNDAAKNYQCQWCLKKFTDLAGYKQHAFEEHEVTIECEHCRQVSYEKYFLKTCDRCNGCDNFVETSKELTSQVKQEYPLLNSALKHRKDVKLDLEVDDMTNQSVNKEPVKCNLCNKNFKSSYKLKVHMRVHTGERPHMCHICGKKFSQKVSLQKHLLSHEGVKNFVCETCGGKFATAYTLKNHMRYHDDKMKNHICPHCSKAFFLPSALKAHIRTHTRERHGSCSVKNQVRKYCCKICGKQFLGKGALNKHSVRHTAVNRPFLCTICNRNFKEEVKLKAHIKFHERRKPFECETCHKRFIDRSALRVHNRTHTGERPFACELCEKRFSVKPTLEAHMRCHTGERPFSCTMCKATFAQRGAFQTHMLFKHNCDP